MCFSQQSLEVEPLVSFLGPSRYVLGPGQVVDSRNMVLSTISTAAPSMYRQAWTGHLVYQAMPGGPTHIFGPGCHNLIKKVHYK